MPISVNNTVAGCIDGISVEQCDIEVYDLNGRKIAKHKMTTAEKVKGKSANRYLRNKTDIRKIA